MMLYPQDLGLASDYEAVAQNQDIQQVTKEDDVSRYLKSPN